MSYRPLLRCLPPLIALCGCSVGYYIALYRPVPPNHGRGEIQFWSGNEKPACAYAEIGIISTDGQYGTEDREILAEMRRRVAQAGCDGVVT